MRKARRPVRAPHAVARVEAGLRAGHRASYGRSDDPAGAATLRSRHRAQRGSASRILQGQDEGVGRKSTTATIPVSGNPGASPRRPSARVTHARAPRARTGMPSPMQLGPPALPGDGGGRPGDGFPAGSRPARPHPGRCPASGGVLPCSAGLIRPYKPEMRKLRVDRSGYRPESPINWT